MEIGTATFTAAAAVAPIYDNGVFVTMASCGCNGVAAVGCGGSAVGAAVISSSYLERTLTVAVSAMDIGEYLVCAAVDGEVDPVTFFVVSVTSPVCDFSE